MVRAPQLKGAAWMKATLAQLVSYSRVMAQLGVTSFQEILCNFLRFSEAQGRGFPDTAQKRFKSYSRSAERKGPGDRELKP